MSSNTQGLNADLLEKINALPHEALLLADLALSESRRLGRVWISYVLATFISVATGVLVLGMSLLPSLSLWVLGAAAVTAAASAAVLASRRIQDTAESRVHALVAEYTRVIAEGALEDEGELRERVMKELRSTWKSS